MDAFLSWIESIWPKKREQRYWGQHLQHLAFNKPLKKLKNAHYAAMLLNHCFTDSFMNDSKLHRFVELWNNASVRHTVDGGTNCLFDLQQQQMSQSLGTPADSHLLSPHLLTGDMDSIRADVLQHYKLKTMIVETMDQEQTDFTKAIQVLSQQLDTLSAEHPVSSILVFYSSSGRLDHVLSIYSTLYQFEKDVKSNALPPLILVDLIGCSVSFLLSKGKHHIPSVESASWCSLVPLNGPVRVSTTGFRWNLKGATLRFGQFISTSQEFDGQSQLATVEIDSENGLLFSFEFK